MLRLMIVAHHTARHRLVIWLSVGDLIIALIQLEPGCSCVTVWVVIDK